MTIVLKKIIRNIVTEKSSGQQAAGQYTFEVRRNATKVEIKHAIKEIYGAEVEKVRILIAPKKERLLKKGQVWIKRPVMKKAIVTLKGKSTIDPNKIGKEKSESKPKATKPATKAGKTTKSTKSKE